MGFADDRRDRERTPLTCPVRLRLPGLPGGEECITRDISLSGVAVACGKPPKVGERGTLVIPYMDGHFEVEFTARVRVVRHVSGGFAVAFEPMDTADRRKLRRLMELAKKAAAREIAKP